MATIETVFIKGNNLRLNIQIRPSANVWIDIPLPENFADCIWKLAQSSADAHEQKMRAEILGDQHKNGGTE